MLAAAFLSWASAVAAPLVPVGEQVAPAIADRQDVQVPDRVQLSGWMGQRLKVNEANRLVKLDADRLLEGYRHRPGRQSWDGEHIGKWLHAATLAWVWTGDPVLRAKLDYVAAELVKCQLADGYLGTYVENNRWRSWDVWAHKYNLIGLLTYVRYTGNTEPLTACRRMADLLCNIFGDQPGKRDIIKAGPQVGMAPTSVLEPMALLYRLTGEQRYLDFCRYIVRAWEQPNGPKIISTLVTTGRVDKIGNAKSYEMLSCLNGALEFYRTVGDEKLLKACLNAWQDIVDHRLYLTGAASYWEIFHDDYDLPNVNNVGETCVTVTWIQFNSQLLRLTGEARFADQLEQVILNQLFGAQKCDGSAWGYYVQMEGRKPYTSNLDGQCCLSSGPRGVALIPTFTVTTDWDGVVVNLYDAGKAALTLRDQTPVELVTETKYPGNGQIRMTVKPAVAKEFAVKLRIPGWCRSAEVVVNGKRFSGMPNREGYQSIRRLWKQGDKIVLKLKLEPQLVIGEHGNQGKVAVRFGPLVLAADEALLEKPSRSLTKAVSTVPLNAVAAAGSELSLLKLTSEPAPAVVKTWSEARVFRMKAVTRRPLPSIPLGTTLSIRLVPFADAGGTGSRYKVWLPLPKNLYAGNVLLEGTESRSRPGDLGGSILDEDFETAVSTRDGKAAEADWFAVQLEAPARVKRVVYAHGKTFHDGGWFDATAGKPRVQVQRTRGGEWETVAEFKDYPATTARNSEEMEGGESVIGTLPQALEVWGVRVIGKPACGDSPQQAFASCAELQAFSE